MRGEREDTYRECVVLTYNVRRLNKCEEDEQDEIEEDCRKSNEEKVEGGVDDKVWGGGG